MESLVSVGGALLGVLVGGLISFSIARQKFAQEKEIILNKLKVEKIEAIYTLLGDLLQEYRSLKIDAESGELTKVDFKSKGVIPFEQLEMLLGLYQPHLLQKGEKLKNTLQDYGKTLFRLCIAKNKGLEDKRNELKQISNEEFKDIKSKINEIKTELRREIVGHV